MDSASRSARRAAWFSVLALGATSTTFAQAAKFAKQVAAPAEDVLSGELRLSDPASTPSISRSLFIPIEFERVDATTWRCATTLPIDADGPLSIGVLSPDSANWTESSRSANGSFEALSLAAGVERRTEVLEDALPGWIVDRFDFASAREGSLELGIEAHGALEPSTGWLLVRTAGSLELAAHVSTLATLGGEAIALVAEVDERAANGERARVVGAVRSARATIESDAGVSTIELVDDGAHQDGLAGDGVFGAFLPRDATGSVRARVELGGVAANGGEFARSTVLAFPVIERRTMLSGAIWTRVIDRVRERIELEAWPLGPAAQMQVSAEVWGTNVDGETVPICWLSRMQEPEVRGAKWILALDLDGRWLDVAHSGPPFELRDVRIQDPDTHVPYDELERTPFDVSELPAIVGRGAVSIAPEMLMGPSSSALSSSQVGAATHKSASPIKPALMLVHGYCSSGNIWPAADFAQPKVVFLDPNANRTHDQFAQLILGASQAAHLSSFGVVTHSQGGCAALQLYTYYHSGLDYAQGPRLIQSLAAPYQGTPLASLGFFACGVNNDMTYSGASAWLAGIPSWARAKAYFWTTSDAGSHCSALTAFFLSDPEDGTVEKAKGQLPGGNSMGHVTGWCHTTGMTYPAGYTDHSRNADMNANAAR